MAVVIVWQAATPVPTNTAITMPPVSMPVTSDSNIDLSSLEQYNLDRHQKYTVGST